MLRGRRDIAVGNVVGSNVFNTLVVLGGAAAASPGSLELPRGVLSFDLPVAIGVSLACLPMFVTEWIMSRGEGGVFVGY